MGWGGGGVSGSYFKLGCNKSAEFKENLVNGVLYTNSPTHIFIKFPWVSNTFFVKNLHVSA